MFFRFPRTARVVRADNNTTNNNNPPRTETEPKKPFIPVTAKTFARHLGAAACTRKSYAARPMCVSERTSPGRLLCCAGRPAFIILNSNYPARRAHAPCRCRNYADTCMLRAYVYLKNQKQNRNARTVRACVQYGRRSDVVQSYDTCAPGLFAAVRDRKTPAGQTR